MEVERPAILESHLNFDIRVVGWNAPSGYRLEDACPYVRPEEGRGDMGILKI